MVISNELKPGNYFSYDGNIYVVLDNALTRLWRFARLTSK